MALMGWLDYRTVRLIGENQSIADALSAQGARITSDAVCDCLVHISAPSSTQLAHELSFETWRKTLDAGLDQRFLLAREFAAARLAERKGGAIVFVSAPEQRFGADHAAVAGALGNLTKTLGVEWARDGVRVNCVQTANEDATLGNLVAYLLSDYAAYITGAVMGIGCND